MISGLLFFNRKYVIGKSVSTSNIKQLSLNSSGMRSDLCYHFDIVNNGEECYIEGDFFNLADSETVHREISRRQYRVFMKHIEGCIYQKKKIDPFAGSIKDKTERKATLKWDGCPESGYELKLTGEEFEFLHQLCLNYLDENWSEMDVRNIMAVEYGYGGDMIGSHKSTKLYMEKNQWYVYTEFAPDHSSKAESRRVEVDGRVIEKVREIISSYDWIAMKDLPLSEIQVLDGATDSLHFTLEPYNGWSINSALELTDEARKMWDEITEVIDGCLK